MAAWPSSPLRRSIAVLHRRVVHGSSVVVVSSRSAGWGWKIPKPPDSRRTSGWKRFHTVAVTALARSLKWTPIPLGVGIGLVAYQQYDYVRTRERQRASETGIELIGDLELTFYRGLPLRSFSRLWGFLNDLELPTWAREPVLSRYARWFGCNLEEAELDSLDRYSNLGEFFRRGLKPSARAIHPGDCVVSPADGRVVHCGTVSENKIEQVKGVSYSLSSFFGANVWSSKLSAGDVDYAKGLLSNPEENQLYQFVVYLAPGDYHRFHSPVDWEIHFRRHFAGDLLSVNPRIAQWIPGLFALNERAVYIGKWKHGFFSMTAVGATNVGSIRIYKDEELQTNCKHQKKGAECSRPFPGEVAAKGEPFGEFNLGSAIVLVFEAPRQYRFRWEPGERILMGNAVCESHALERSIQMTELKPTSSVTSSMSSSKNWLEYSVQSIVGNR